MFSHNLLQILQRVCSVISLVYEGFPGDEAEVGFEECSPKITEQGCQLLRNKFFNIFNSPHKETSQILISSSPALSAIRKISEKRRRWRAELFSPDVIVIDEKISGVLLLKNFRAFLTLEKNSINKVIILLKMLYCLIYVCCLRTRLFGPWIFP